MDRLNRYRNALKHAGAFPGRKAVEDALTTTASFFENNAPIVFGVAFDAIDMTDVVPQDDVRSRLKASSPGSVRVEGEADGKPSYLLLTLLPVACAPRSLLARL